MKLTLTALLLVASTSVQAWTTTTVTPRADGTISAYSYGNGGYQTTTITPQYGVPGAYNYRSYGSGGNSWGNVTPNYGTGGYNINTYGTKNWALDW